MRANQWSTRSLSKAFQPELLIATQPAVERLSGDSEVPACHGDVASYLLDVLDHGESASSSLASSCSVNWASSSLRIGRLSVSDLRQFQTGAISDRSHF